MSYWKAYLNELEHCHFPKYDSGTKEGEAGSLFLDVETRCLSELQLKAAEDPSVLPALLRAAWSVVLHCFTGLEDVCFKSGEVAGGDQGRLADTATALMNAKIAKFRLDGGKRLSTILEQAKADYLDGAAYGAVRMDAEVETLFASKNAMCDTAILEWENLDTRLLKKRRGVFDQLAKSNEVLLVSS